MFVKTADYKKEKGRFTQKSCGKLLKEEIKEFNEQFPAPTANIYKPTTDTNEKHSLIINPASIVTNLTNIIPNDYFE